MKQGCASPATELLKFDKEMELYSSKRKIEIGEKITYVLECNAAAGS